VTARRFQRFEHPAMQAALVADLKRAGLDPAIDEEGSVVYSDGQAEAVVSASHRIRDGKFRWYLLRPQDAGQAARLRALLEAAQLAYFVEHSESGTWFTVPRADQERHEELFAQC